MIEKPGWWTKWFNIEKTNSSIKPSKKENKRVEWRIWYTLAEVEELIKKDKNKRPIK